MGSVTGHHVLVTGGGSGIGLGCAEALIAAGATVTIGGRTEARLADAAEKTGAHYVVVDVTDEAQVASAVAAATARTGRLDGVIASAGGSETIGPITQIDVDAFRRTVDLNVTGTFLTLKHAGRVMAAQGGGSFVGISSIASTRTHRWFGAYGIGKAGIDHLCRLGADELGASGVRVNSIQPGLVDTEMVAMLTAEGPVLDDYLDCMPISRVGTVRDIAAMAAFLLGDDASWVTGQNLAVDGGWTAI
jgi:NAD(P)-dependent dehydrogenase (short-subunit alcohol dehydrogenase family)